MQQSYQQQQDDSGSYACTQCERVFDNRLSLTRHLGHHTREQKRVNGVKPKPQQRQRQSNGHGYTNNAVRIRPAGYAPPCRFGFGPPIRAAPPNWIDGPRTNPPGVAVLGFGPPRRTK
jgi:hypothetical protein